MKLDWPVAQLVGHVTLDHDTEVRILPGQRGLCGFESVGMKPLNK